MIRFLKTGITAEQDAADIAKVRTTVETILADIESRAERIDQRRQRDIHDAAVESEHENAQPHTNQTKPALG